ncbi:MAG: MoaD/ThiS family protein [Helicobacteraceae bacterium]|jgi:adenylyltransferase/sulfurtransferase|nr:MoaD/ThiS family protein [Helicobacteraceae bacterium]
MAIIQLPAALKAYVDHQSEIEVSGANALEALEALAKTYPSIRQHIFDADDKPRSFINIFIGDVNIRSLEGFDTKIDDKTVLTLIPAIAGGAPQIG